MIIIMYFVATVMICIIIAVEIFLESTKIQMRWCEYCEEETIFIKNSFCVKYRCVRCEELKMKNKELI